jgi:arabinofuranosyltransferase
VSTSPLEPPPPGERQPDRTSSAAAALPRTLGLTLLVLALVVLVLAMLSFWGFVQDDAYISLRYAGNLVGGKGLVFNPGERVEGFTNLSWTLIEALCCVLGLPALHVVCFIGAGAALALVVLLWIEAGGTRLESDPGLGLTAGLGACLLASNVTLAAWSVSGLEESFFTLLVFGGYLAFVRHQDRTAAAVWLLATATRPEGALAFALGAGVRAVALIRCGKRPSRAQLAAAALYAVGFSALLGFRLLYYGSPVPNTFYVKGMANRFTHLHGLAELQDFLRTGAFGAVVVVAFLGLATAARGAYRGARQGSGRPDGEAVAFSACFLVSFLYYTVRVGGDGMELFRLYMPVIPFAVLWAVSGVERALGSALQAGPRSPEPGSRVVAIAALVALVAMLLVATEEGIRSTVAHQAFRVTSARLEASHGAAGQLLEEQARRRPSGRPLTVLAQDMGLTPYLAPHARFVDAIGLTDRTVATTVYRYGYNPLTRELMWREPEQRARIETMEKELRDYLRAQKADYVFAPLTCAPGEFEAVRAAFDRRDAGDLAARVGANMFFYGLLAEPAFREQFELVRSYQYSPGYYMLLYQRKSLGRPS